MRQEFRGVTGLHVVKTFAIIVAALFVGGCGAGGVDLDAGSGAGRSGEPAAVRRKPPENIAYTELESDILEGELLTLTCALQNPWDETVEWPTVVSDCGCSGAIVTPARLGPRQTGQVTISVNGFRVTGPERQLPYLAVREELREVDELPLRVRVTLREGFSVSPGEFNFGVCEALPVLQRSISIRSREPIPPDAVEWELPGPEFTAELVDLSSAESAAANAEHEYVAVLTLHPRDLGRHLSTHCRLTLRGFLGRDRVFEFRTSGQIRSPVHVTPSRPLLGELFEDRSVEVTLQMSALRPDSPFQFVGLSGPEWLILDTEVGDPQIGDVTPLTVRARLKPGVERPGAGIAVLTLALTCGETPVAIELPSTFAVSEADFTPDGSR